MDISRMVQPINNLNKYVRLTNDIKNENASLKVHLNMSTVLALKKIRSLEVEYFNKNDENGAAFKIFDMMMLLPPSKTWSILGPELVSLVQYWLDALKKHLIIHKSNWWSFLSPLLKIIQELSLKDKSVSNALVQETVESLFDIATGTHVDILQQNKIIQTLNSCCGESSREIRLALRSRFNGYLLKLSRILQSCGDVSTQYCIIETLLRWLVPRRDMTLRRQAANEWFPKPLYGEDCVQIFLEKPWVEFFKDARDFLNAHNKTDKLVISVVCKFFSIGSLVLINDSDERVYWLDINLGTKSISMMLEPKILESLGSSTMSSNALVMAEGNIERLNMYRKSSEAILEVTVLDPQQVYQTKEGLHRDIKIKIQCESDWNNIEQALQTILHNKCQMFANEEQQTMAKNLPASVVKSTPAQVHRPRHSGYIVRPRVPLSWQSPSTASTSSLLKLREKLTTFSGFKFDKEVVRVCVAPQLSNVTELSETDEQQSFHTATTFKLRHSGYSHKRKANLERSNVSDSDIIPRKPDGRFQSIIEEDEENSVSCLLLATLDSADDSVINDTLDRLPKDIQADKIVDMLMQEALQSNTSKSLTSNTDQKTTKSKSIDVGDNLNPKVIIEQVKLPKRTIVSNSATDESNIDETPNYVNIRRNFNKYIKNPVIPETENAFDSKTVEEFFSQHLYENNERDVLISPTLARKINETSSEVSDEFDVIPHVGNVDDNDSLDVNNIDIIECLNDIVDKVCKDFEKCADCFDKEIVDIAQELQNNLDIPDTVNDNLENPKELNTQDKVSTPTSTQAIKLHYNTNKKQTKKTRAKKKKGKLNLEPPKMSTIIERDSIIEKADDNAIDTKTPERGKDTLSDLDAPLIRRKRKLYSPKDDETCNNLAEELSQPVQTDMLVDLNVCDKTPKSIATSYKELESIRRSTTQKLRNKQLLRESMSPRTKKFNDVFDKLKNTIEGEKNIKLAAKNTRSKAYTVYNFSSDSEDEDFAPKKRISIKTKTVNSESGKVIRNVRRKTRSKEKKEKELVTSPKQTNIRVTRKRQAKQPEKLFTKKVQKQKFGLIDEHMRDPAPEILNISIELNNPDHELCKEPELKITENPVMEAISEDENVSEKKPVRQPRKKQNKRTKNAKLATKKIQIKAEVPAKPEESDKTASPLPGLVVETMPLRKDAENISFTNTILEKLQEMCNEDKPPDVSLANTTQNLLSDIEPITYSPVTKQSKECTQKSQNSNKSTLSRRSKSDKEIQSNIALELKESLINYSVKREAIENKPDKLKQTEKISPAKSVVTQRVTRSKTKEKTKSKFIAETNAETSEHILQKQNITISDPESEKSIETVGKSPITGHGDFEEEPPKFEDLNKRIHDRRELEIEDLSDSLKRYYRSLNDKIQVEKSDSSDKNNNLDTSNIIINSPVVSVSRITLEELSNWIPQKRNSVFGSSESTEISSKKSERIENINRKKTIEHGSRNSPRIRNINNKNTNVCLITPISSKSNSDNNKIKNVTKKTSPTFPVTPSIKETKFRKSTISPIKSFDEILNEKETKSDLDMNKENLETFKLVPSISQKSIAKSTTLASSQNSKSTPKIVSPVENVFRIPLKRKLSPSPSVNTKKMAVNTKTGTATSSNSTVDDWFNRNEQSSSKSVLSRAESFSTPLQENMENILEKIDTTLVEVNQNTSKMLANMFLDVQKQLDDMKDELKKMYLTGAKELISSFIQTVDAQFLELDRRSQTMVNQFMVNLKQQAKGMILKDCKQKKLMVTLLKEDAQAVLNHIASTKKRNH